MFGPIDNVYSREIRVWLQFQEQPAATQYISRIKGDEIDNQAESFLKDLSIWRCAARLTNVREGGLGADYDKYR